MLTHSQTSRVTWKTYHMRFAVIIPARSAVSHICDNLSITHESTRRAKYRFAKPPCRIPGNISLVVMKFTAGLWVPKILQSREPLDVRMES
jgi:hypothetical protein